MSTESPGSIVWQDLTVPDAEALRAFYERVAGWSFEDHAMGDYNDYNVNARPGGPSIAGLCHQRGENANVPPVWMLYIQVESVSDAVEQVTANGGEVMDGPRMMGSHHFCVFRDPAGAIAALIGPT